MKRQLLAGGLLLATLLSIAWWIVKLTTPVAEQPQAAVDSPSAYAEHLRVHRYGTDGRLEQTLITPHMEHYDASNTSELRQPVLWRFNPDLPPWRMQAEQALANRASDQVYLPGEVVIDRDAAAQQPAYHIVTRDLTLETADAHATTEQPVLIESGQQRVTAVGLEGWLREPVKLKLLSQVRARYVFD